MTRNWDIAFLGGLFPKETEMEIYENSIKGMQNAANALQWKLVNGLEKNSEKTVKIINSLYVGSYPRRYKKAFIRTYPFRHCEGAEDINVGFCNVCGIKRWRRKRTIRPHLKEWAKNGRENKIIIAYGMTSIFVDALCYVKKINPKIKTCLVVPDLPQYMNMSDNRPFWYDKLKKFDIKQMERELGEIDLFVLLTKHMHEVLKVENYVVIEGIATEMHRNTTQIEENSENFETKKIFYAGGINEKYGVLNLINAFRDIADDSYRLILCGSGDCEELVKEIVRQDNRIIFLGSIKREEVLALQQEATIVVNPRQATEEFTKYSFPSKNLEYLSSGTPLIAYKLPGIPDEYDDYIFYVPDNSVNSLKETIVKVCEKHKKELFEFGKKARDFVLKEKNEGVQTKKIIEWFEINAER